MSKYNFKFVDLFAGIGGFHQAMADLGGTCVMSCEINDKCRATYSANFTNTDLRGDINDIDPKTIPDFDVLCAGFPCQPFSKAGHQKGFHDPERGNLFYKIMDILDVHPEVKFVILENVKNLADKSENWEIITSELGKRNFFITESPVILSPSNFGIAQLRQRVYILGLRKDIRNEKILKNGCIHIKDLRLETEYKKCQLWDYRGLLETNVSVDYIVKPEIELMICAWDEFRINTGIKLIGFPIWISCFGLDVDDEEESRRILEYDLMPKWKQNYYRKNRELYLNNKEFIDKWISKYDMLHRIKLFQKFEWNCGNDIFDMHNTIIQVRQSGIRVKRPTFFPSLVAMTNTPIIWDNNFQHYRYITPREAANQQNFWRTFKFIGDDNTIYHQLGNAVNVRVLKILAEHLFKLAQKNWRVNE